MLLIDISKEQQVLLEEASLLGATDCALVSAKEIQINDRMAEFCREPGCSFYRVSASCPPAVGGPDVFRKWVLEYEYAIVIRIDLPASLLYGSERLELMGLLHLIVSGVESKAHDLGYIKSKGFAGGSCKELFCQEHSDCQVLSSSLGCRNPKKARPSMSGFGIDVGHLMCLANWPEKKLRTTTKEGGDDSLSWLAGLVLLG